MLKRLKLAAIAVACIALLGVGASLTLASSGGYTAGSASETEYTPKPGDQGCTLGYWKQVHLNTWTGYSTSDLFDQVFGVNYKPTLTLLGALNLGGGGYAALARQAAAALLNASNPNVNFGLTSGQIVGLVQKAFTTGEPEQIKNEIAAFNEVNCPIDAHGAPIH
jgi:hypothetical protein